MMPNKYTVITPMIPIMVFSVTLIAADTDHHQISPDLQSALHRSSDLRDIHTLSEEM